MAMDNKLKNYIIIIGIACSLSILVIFLSQHHAYKESKMLIEKQFDNQQMSITKLTALRIEDDIKLLIKELELLSIKPVVKKIDVGKSRELFKEMFNHVKNLYVNDVAVLDSRGIVRLPLMAPQLTGIDFSFRKYFKKASTLKNSVPTYEFIEFKGVDSGEKGIVIAMPLFLSGGEFNGVVLFTVKINELVNGFIPSGEANSDYWVIDDSGNVLYNSLNEADADFMKLCNTNSSFREFIEHSKTSKGFTTRCIPPEGDVSVATSYPLNIAGQPSLFVISTPVKSVSGFLNHISLQYVNTTVIMFLAISGISIFIISLINKWYLALKDEVSVRKRAEEAIMKSEAKWRSFVQNAPDIIFTTNRDGIIQFINYAPEGLTPEEAVGTKFYDYVPEEYHETVRQALSHVFQTDEPTSYEIAARGPHDILSWYTTHVGPIKREDVVDAAIFITRDMTDRKRMERRINESLKEKDVLLKEIHHRVKNNMAIISALLQLQARYSDDEKVTQLFRDSQSRISSMALVHEKLYQTKDFTDINFREYVEEFVRHILSTYGKKEGDISLMLSVDDISLNIDTMIPCGLIINELVTNSIKHAFEGVESPEISIALNVNDNFATLVYRDNGMGIPEHVDIQIIETLGLQIIKMLAVQLRGVVKLDRDNGTSFIIDFKLAA
jgi:PAS domain S-box-containing protein